MHALDHLIAEPLGAAVEGRDQRVRPLTSASIGANARWQARSGSGWIRLLPSNPSRRPSSASRRKPSRSSRPLKTPSNAAIPPRAPRARSSAAMPRSARASRRAASARSARRSLVPAIRPGATLRDLGGRKHACGGLDHRQHRLADRLGDFADEVGRDGARNDDQIGVRAADRIEIERMPFGADAVDPDRDGHRPAVRDGFDRGRRAAALSSAFTASSRSRTTRSAPPPAPWQSRAGWTRAGTAATARRTGRCSCRFSLPLAVMAVASCP